MVQYSPTAVGLLTKKKKAPASSVNPALGVKPPEAAPALIGQQKPPNSVEDAKPVVQPPPRPPAAAVVDDGGAALPPSLPPGGLGAGALPPGGVGASDPKPIDGSTRTFVPVSDTRHAEPRDTSNDAVDAAVRELVLNQLQGAGKADTAEQEALIQQMLGDNIGAGLVDSRARAGRAGMGFSGGQMALEGDIRRKASQTALDEILGLRRGENQRSIDNAFQAVDAETAYRRQANQAAIQRMALEALQAELGLDDEDFSGGGLGDLGGIGDALSGLRGAVINSPTVSGVETETPDLPSSGGAVSQSDGSGRDPANATPVSSPPPNARRSASASESTGQEIYYDSGARRWYVVE